MATNPKELAPQFDFKLSNAVRHLEERLATAKHNEAVLAKNVRLLTSNLQQWKQLYKAAYDELTKLRRSKLGKE